MGIRILSVVIAFETFVFLFLVACTCQPVRLILRTYEEVSRSLMEGRAGFLNYAELEQYLVRNGAAFHFGKWINPVSFMALRIILGGTGLLLGIFYGMAAGVILAVILSKLPDILLMGMNKKDNEMMLPELKLLYHGISMQVRSGVYITDALSEMYGSIRGERLRRALSELSGELVVKADVEEAMERFQKKFDNRYVDALCITVLQALESGQAVELLSDIAEQIKDMEVDLMGRKKHKLDRRITFYQLGILSAVLAIVLYSCIVHMFQTAVLF